MYQLLGNETALPCQVKWAFGSCNNNESQEKPSGFYSTIPDKSWFSPLKKNVYPNRKKPPLLKLS